MKVGSLVELVDDNFSLPQNLLSKKYGAQTPRIGIIYTIRSIYNCGGEKLIRLEEILNPVLPYTGNEGGYFMYRFREVQSAISNIEEHINENTLEPELI